MPVGTAAGDEEALFVPFNGYDLKAKIAKDLLMFSVYSISNLIGGRAYAVKALNLFSRKYPNCTHATLQLLHDVLIRHDTSLYLGNNHYNKHRYKHAYQIEQIFKQLKNTVGYNLYIGELE